MKREHFCPLCGNEVNIWPEVVKPTLRVLFIELPKAMRDSLVKWFLEKTHLDYMHVKVIDKLHYDIADLKKKAGGLYKEVIAQRHEILNLKHGIRVDYKAKRVIYDPEPAGILLTDKKFFNRLYSALMDEFDEMDNMDEAVPMRNIDEWHYRVSNEWHIIVKRRSTAPDLLFSPEDELTEPGYKEPNDERKERSRRNC